MIGLIFGPPGSGKGTQAAHVEREFKLSHLSTGDILRAEVARGTETGKEAERIMRAGDLMPDAMTNAYWAAVLQFVADQSKLDSILRKLDTIQATAYK